MMTDIQIHLAGVFLGGCRPFHNQAVLCVGPASVGVSRYLAHKDGTCGQRGRERGNPRSASILIPRASRVPARDLQRGLGRSPSPLLSGSAAVHYHPGACDHAPVPAGRGFAALVNCLTGAGGSAVHSPRPFSGVQHGA